MTYTYAASGMGTQSAWDNMPIFKDIKPCRLKNGIVQYYLNPNNYAQKIDGTTVNITTITDGDVMVEFPIFGYKIYKEDNFLHVQVTNKKNVAGFCYDHCLRDDGGYSDYFYVGAYTSSANYNSLSKSAIAYGSNSLATVRNSIKTTKGARYRNMTFEIHKALQCLYLIRYADRDSSFLLGYSGGNTGAADTLGLYTKNGQSGIKCFGIEYFYAAAYAWYQNYLDGIYVTNNEVYIKPNNFSDTATYIKLPQKIVSGTGCLMNVIGTNEGGFLPTALVTDTTYKKYWCDNCGISSGSQYTVTNTTPTGGGINESGLFSVTISASSPSVSSRIVYV